MRIIGLPANIFFGTGIPTIIMVLRQKRENTDVLVIDASKGFVKDAQKNRLRASDIRRVVDTVKGRLSIDKYSHLVSRDEIRANDYNLNIPRLCSILFEEEEPIDIKAVMAEIKELEAKRAELDKEIERLFERNWDWLNNYTMAEIDNIPEMRPSFDNIRRQDEGGNEYWSSRDLCAAMGYSAYWKFQRVIDKAIKVQVKKGMNVDDHFNQAVDMVRIGSGSFRKVNIFRLSRMACMIVAENADAQKVLVQQARDYFTRTISTNELMQNSLSSNILLYKTAQGEARIEVIFNSETFLDVTKAYGRFCSGWMYGLFNYHLGQIYETGELTKEATIRKIGIVQSEGERDVERTPLFYNLDAIIAVGYRVNSYQATQFRIWATSVLKEFIIKGYALMTNA